MEDVVSRTNATSILGDTSVRGEGAASKRVVEAITRAMAAMKDARVMLFIRYLLLIRRNDPYGKVVCCGFCNTHRYPLRFDTPQQVRIEIGIGVEDFPTEYAIVSGRNAAECESSARVARRCLEKVRPIPLALRHKHDTRSSDGSGTGIDGDSINMARPGAENDLESPARDAGET
jgi:hypothetical protein